MPSKKTLLLGAAAVGVVAGAAYVLSRRRGHEDDERDEFQADPAARSQAADPKPTAPIEETKASENELTTEYSFRQAESAPAPPPVKQPIVPKEVEGVLEFPNLGLVLKLPPHWSANEDQTPMPNVSIVALMRADYKTDDPMMMMTGQVPIVLISVEDITSENLSLDEFKEKSKAMAMSQMMMQSGGQFMPRISFDGRMTVGPFQHSLEYEHVTPQFGVKVLNLITVENSLAYVVQLMASPAVFDAVHKDVMAIAKSAAITSKAPDFSLTKSYVQVTSPGASHTFRVPAGWKIDPKESPLAEMTTPSSVRPETLVLYAGTKDLPSVNITSTETIAPGVTLTHGIDAQTKREKKIIHGAGHTLVVSPTSFPAVSTPIALLTSIISTMEASSAPATKASLRYVNNAHGISFDVSTRSKLLESRINDRTIVYAPLGIDQYQPDPEAPMLTIRVGDPSNDPDCQNSLGEWLDKLKQEAADGSLQDIRRDKLCGHDCVTFVTQEMQEVGPGQREEHKAKVIIIMKDNRTAMLRWECASGAWRKHERKLYELLESWKMI